jgi:hypothetical protein
MSLPPWIRSIKRPLDKLATPPRRTSFDDLPDTEPGEELGMTPRPRRSRPEVSRPNEPDDGSK